MVDKMLRIPSNFFDVSRFQCKISLLALMLTGCGSLAGVMKRSFRVGNGVDSLPVFVRERAGI